MELVALHGLLALGAAVLAAPAASQEPSDLRLKLGPGEVLHYRVTREQGLEFRVGSKLRKGSRRTEESFKVTVRDVAGDGTARAEVAFEVLVGAFDNDVLDVHFDSRTDAAVGAEGEPIFGAHAAQLGRTRAISIRPDGTCTLAAPQDAADDDPVDWTGMFPEVARLRAGRSAPEALWNGRESFEPRMILEHGLAAWPVTATWTAKPLPAPSPSAFEITGFELDGRFALATDDGEIARGLADGRILEEPGQGRGTLEFARPAGVLVRYELEGTTAFHVALEEGRRATRASSRFRIRNRLVVELLRWHPPPR